MNIIIAFIMIALCISAIIGMWLIAEFLIGIWIEGIEIIRHYIK